MDFCPRVTDKGILYYHLITFSLGFGELLKGIYEMFRHCRHPIKSMKQIKKLLKIIDDDNHDIDIEAGEVKND